LDELQKSKNAHGCHWYMVHPGGIYPGEYRPENSKDHSAKFFRRKTVRETPEDGDPKNNLQEKCKKPVQRRQFPAKDDN
jgi:hypothetical protein